ncbi:hypothetical protein ACVWVY_006067 [Bradyrhizobium sp. URHC0002]
MCAASQTVAKTIATIVSETTITERLTMPKKTIVEPKSQIAPKSLDDTELDTVCGGTMLQNAFSNVVKSIGEGLSGMARKG